MNNIRFIYEIKINIYLNIIAHIYYQKHVDSSLSYFDGFSYNAYF